MGIWLGAGLVETDGRDFFNVFILCGPDGNIAGTARKDNAEAFCFKRGLGIHVIETTIGRIGVGICADNHFASLIALLQAEAVDLILMPHAWPTRCERPGWSASATFASSAKSRNSLGRSTHAASVCRWPS